MWTYFDESTIITSIQVNKIKWLLSNTIRIKIKQVFFKYNPMNLVSMNGIFCYLFDSAWY